MQARLVAWARAVKARQRRLPPHARVPVLWLLTDEHRMPDPLPAIRALPPGLAGVVFRHDADPARAALGKSVARICRARRLALTVAGDWRLAARLRAGLHLRAHDTPRPPGKRLATASAHGRAELLLAVRRHAALVFVSPLYATDSHRAATPLGRLRWLAITRDCRVPALALGGLDGVSVRRLPGCAGIGTAGRGVLP
jgi:thiamine-phosphate pyrophosphorylase